MKIIFLEDFLSISRLISKDFFCECKRLGIYVEFDGERKFLFKDSLIEEYDMLVNYNFTNDYHKLLVLKAKSYGVYTILLQDGVFEWSNSFLNNNKQYCNVDHDLFLIFGTNQELNFLKMLSRTHCIKYVPEYLKHRF